MTGGVGCCVNHFSSRCAQERALKLILSVRMARVSWQRRLEEEELLQRILERRVWRILQYSKDLTVESGADVLSEWICGMDAWLVLDLLVWILEGRGVWDSGGSFLRIDVVCFGFVFCIDTSFPFLFKCQSFS